MTSPAGGAALKPNFFIVPWGHVWNVMANSPRSRGPSFPPSRGRQTAAVWLLLNSKSTLRHGSSQPVGKFSSKFQSRRKMFLMRGEEKTFLRTLVIWCLSRLMLCRTEICSCARVSDATVHVSCEGEQETRAGRAGR